MTDPQFAFEGTCPICREHVTFTAADNNLRESLKCPVCAESVGGSMVRERGLYHALNLHGIDATQCDVHDIAPWPFGASGKLRQVARSYTMSNFWPDQPLGEMVLGAVNANAEKQPFENNSFDLVVSLDLMEHVNHPDRVFSEIHRTLRDRGYYVFTAPTYPHLTISYRIALYTEGGVEHYEPPEYHGNPIDDQGSLVTWRFGYDLPNLIRSWADFDVTVMRFDAPGLGLMGYFTEVYVCRKR